MKVLGMWAAMILLLGLSACGSATYVKKDARGGQLALHGSYGFAMGDARTHVVDHCNGRFEQHEERGLLTYRCLEPDQLAAAGDAPGPSPTRDSGD